jgi:cobyrinic acid a,c-diamide synthase
MILTKNSLADMLIKYINREIDLSNLVDWAEDMIKEVDFEEENFELIKEIVARIGLADVREFGLTWDDCYDYLHRLGYDVKVELLEAK